MCTDYHSRMESRMTLLKENIVRRKVHESYFLINITQNYLNDKCSLYEINETGNFILSQMELNKSMLEIAKELKKCINEDISLNELECDIKAFIETLYNEGFIQSKHKNQFLYKEQKQSERNNERS